MIEFQHEANRRERESECDFIARGRVGRRKHAQTRRFARCFDFAYATQQGNARITNDDTRESGTLRVQTHVPAGVQAEKNLNVSRDAGYLSVAKAVFKPSVNSARDARDELPAVNGRLGFTLYNQQRTRPGSLRKPVTN
ncbi:hypothetical protein [Caballeronia sp. Lep1P3]|uniref:hypothetical protein n=1 Tax=Caballeronia sp. Lep1P3 TaxID=2878150 RepID=UPI001FD5D99C|nr:hypothetical protein [Caballeronia sp. Lep1P3]